MPAVSIITPAFRTERVVGATIASVLAQTFTDWEMLVVDDCSPDGTAAAVERAASGDPRVRLIRRAKNGGAASARNAALALASARYVAFLDSDDLWLPAKLERQIEFQRRTSAAITFTQFRRITEDGAQVGRLIDVPERIGYRGLLRNTAIATSTVLVDREIAGPIEMKTTYYDDYACWLAILKRGGAAFGLRLDLMRYRIGGRSLSRDKSKSAREVWKTYREIEGLNPFASAWYFTNYAARGWLKYRRF